jgi:uncharacterized membrane protein
VVPSFMANRHGCRLMKLIKLFLEHIVEKEEHVSNKWSSKYWIILVQFVVIAVLWYNIM